MQRIEEGGTGDAPLHGLQVGIGTLAVARLYEQWCPIGGKNVF